MKQDASFGLIPIYRDKDKIEFLLVKHLAGHWAFPKGHAEGEELPLESAQREFEEETGILQYRVDDTKTFLEEYYPQKNGQIFHKIVTYYPAWVSSKQVKLQEAEIADSGWFEYKEALGRMTFPAGKKILRAIKKYLTAKIDNP